MSRELRFEPTSIFVLRASLLPFDEILAWSSGLESLAELERGGDLAVAVAEDRMRLRERLRAQLERPEVLEALYLASPDLVAGLPAWIDAPESKKGRRLEQGLVRYFQRMCSRPTPFGLFAGCATGSVSTSTRLWVSPVADCRRHTRIDMDYLSALCERLAARPEVRSVLRVRPNSSLYRVGGRLRYTEVRTVDRSRTHHLVALEPFEALELVLERAAGGGLVADLAKALVEADPDGEITGEQAEEFVLEMLDNQILVSDLAPRLTGVEPLEALVEQLSALLPGAAVADTLARCHQHLARLDATGLGIPAAEYQALAALVEPLGGAVEPSRVVQVDLVRPGAGLLLGTDISEELARAVRILHEVSPEPGSDPLSAFRNAFLERYGEGCEVPLALALDEELGIGFERSAIASADASALLAGLALDGLGVMSAPVELKRDRMLAQWVGKALGRDQREIRLDEAALAPLRRTRLPPLPEAFCVTATVIASSARALADGEFEILMIGTFGPSGVRLLGRFCHGDEDLQRGVAEHIAAEQAHDPDAVFAEIVHLPGGRIGNVLLRPVLRDAEIVVLARSGAPEESQIPLDDLLVTVRRDAVELRSRRLGRRIVPRLTSAHNASRESLGVYRFLAALQEQGVVGPLGWRWGPFENLPFLPRVRCGRLILSRTRWTVHRGETAPLARASGGERFRLVQEWHRSRRLDRFAQLADGDNMLLVDFENPLSIDAWIELVKERDVSLLVELYPGPDQLCAEGPEGRYVHEIVVPFVARQPVAAARRSEVGAAAPAVLTRTFPPHSRWLYFKLYTGTSTADRLLQEVVAPACREALVSGAASRWFFLRYADPEWHLRVRLEGDPELLRELVLPRVSALCEPRFATGELWKLQLDTYDREVERYGGEAAIELAEQLFWRDSEAVSALLGLVAESGDPVARWRLTCLGMDRLLADFSLSELDRRDFATAMRTGMGQRYDEEPLRLTLAERWRRERKAVEGLLQGHYDDEIMARGAEIFARRSESLRPLAAELARRERQGRLTLPVREILPSFVHMFVNRMCRSGGPEHELVLYDFLSQAYSSILARAAKAGGAAVREVAVS